MLKLYQCDPCQTEGEMHEAKYRCKNCDEKLCSSCRDDHRKFQKLRDHEIQQLSSNPPICTPCRSTDIVKEAGFFCGNCDEHLCNACKDDHKKFKKLREHPISKVEESTQQDTKSRHTESSLTKDILNTDAPATTELYTPPSNSNPGGKVLYQPSKPLNVHTTAESRDTASLANVREPFSILAMSLQSVNVIKLKSSEEGSMRVHGCAFMSSGELLLVNVYKREVLHLDSSFKIRERLKIPTVSEIAALNDNAAVVTSGYGLEFLEVRPKLRSVKSVSLGESTQGVAVGGDLIYVSCFQGDEDNGNIRVLNKEGEEIRRIDAIQNGLVLFKKPYHLAASKTRVYISGDTLTCLRQDGTLVYQYEDESLGMVSGMYVDHADNVLACAYESKFRASEKFYVILTNGKRYPCETLETSIEIPGYNCSDCISVRPSDKTLAMGALSEMYIFSMT